MSSPPAANGCAASCSATVRASIAFLGITAYRAAFDQPLASLGRQAGLLAGATVWVLPNPSGLNAHYQLDSLVLLFAEMRASLQSTERT